MKKQLIGFGAGMSLLSFAGYVDAATVNYAAKLTGAEVVPPVTTAATGDAKCAVDDTTYKTTCTITETGIGKVTTVALYAGAKGKDGNQIFGVPCKAGAAAGSYDCTGAMLKAQHDALVAGGIYAQISSQAQKQGEIRGQLAPAGAPSDAGAGDGGGTTTDGGSSSGTSGASGSSGTSGASGAVGDDAGTGGGGEDDGGGCNVSASSAGGKDLLFAATTSLAVLGLLQARRRKKS